jgi:vancomycin aglycone glucosyltransferase
MFGDQPFWARRVRELGIGTSVPMAGLTADGLASALHDAIDPAIAERANSVARQIVIDGAAVAARRLVDEVT